MLASEAGVHVKVHAVIEAQLLHGWAPKQAALHALDVHSLRAVQEPVMERGCCEACGTVQLCGTLQTQAR